MAADEVRDGQRGQITGLKGSGKEVGVYLAAMGNYWNVLGEAATWSDDGFRRLICTGRWNGCERMRGDRDDQGDQQGLS